MHRLKRNPYRRKGFTLIELLVVISIIALLVGILLPALGAARRTAQQMQNSTQVRGIQQAMVIFAQGNNTWFPGRDTNGALETGHTWRDGATQATGVHDTAGWPGYRFRRLAEDGHFTGEYMISPSETKTPWNSGPLNTDNFSYALLEIQEGLPQRYNEWRQTNNAEAVVISDRAIAYNAANNRRSVHTDPKSGDDWKGSVGWNDNHVTFASDYVVDTKYGRTATLNDDLFGKAGTHDAAMLYNGVGGATYTDGQYIQDFGTY